MKFGEYLKANIHQEWASEYLNYDKLKVIIAILREKQQNRVAAESTEGIVVGSFKKSSLTMPMPTDAAAQPRGGTFDKVTPEEFFTNLEDDMKRVDAFTRRMVASIRFELAGLESCLPDAMAKDDTEQIIISLDEIAENFLRLEKYVNLNCTGFHKILKKHDKWLPNKCKQFYVERLNEQPWVKGDYSDVMVTMSKIYSTLRGDEEIEAKQEETQNFVRSTKKYWVKTEDISRVKYHVLQHLPVFLQSTMGGDTDSQLVNSVYVDNTFLELYHGRLDKTKNAIALRMRWYGTGLPQTVFVERKTHRESWAGEISVKERFIVPEDKVLDILQGKFDKDAEIAKMKKKGKTPEEIEEWNSLVSEVLQAVNSKQLKPTMRTQYMRTAFQIPFDATVRISLDTNLCLIKERTGDTSTGLRWFRDPKKAVPLTEITRFPHAVLEVKLEVQDEESTPEWVTQLINSGLLSEVHKFSKFIHGCAVLLRDDVRAYPYWIDDPSLRKSIEESGAAEALKSNPGANQVYSHLLVNDANMQTKPRARVNARGIVLRSENALSEPSQYRSVDEETGLAATCGEYMGNNFSFCEHALPPDASNMVLQKVEPKLLFANERTYIKWLKMAVSMASIAIAILAFTKSNSTAQYYAMTLLPISFIFIIYASNTFLWRVEKIRTRDPLRWDDPMGPIVLTSCLVVALLVQFGINLYQFVNSVRTD